MKGNLRRFLSLTLVLSMVLTMFTPAAFADEVEHVFGEPVITAATCTEAGNISITCADCGATVEEEIPASGHAFGEYVYNDDATEEADGTKTATCATCGVTDTVTAEGTMIVVEADPSEAPAEEPVVEETTEEDETTEEGETEQPSAEATEEPAEIPTVTVAEYKHGLVEVGEYVDGKVVITATPDANYFAKLSVGGEEIEGVYGEAGVMTCELSVAEDTTVVADFYQVFKAVELAEDADDREVEYNFAQELDEEALEELYTAIFEACVLVPNPVGVTVDDIDEMEITYRAEKKSSNTDEEAPEELWVLLNEEVEGYETFNLTENGKDQIKIGYIGNNSKYLNAALALTVKFVVPQPEEPAIEDMPIVEDEPIVEEEPVVEEEPEELLQIGKVGAAAETYAAEAGDPWYWNSDKTVLYVKDGANIDLYDALVEKYGTPANNAFRYDTKDYSTSGAFGANAWYRSGTKITDGSSCSLTHNQLYYAVAVTGSSWGSDTVDTVFSFSINHYYILNTAVAEGSPSGAGITVGNAATAYVVKGNSVAVVVNSVEGYTASVADSKGNAISNLDAYAPSESTTLTVTYTSNEVAKYSITVNTENGEYGTATLKSEAELPAGAEALVEVTPKTSDNNEKYEVVSVMAGDTALSKNANGYYVYTMGEADVTITVTFSATILNGNTSATIEYNTSMTTAQLKQEIFNKVITGSVPEGVSVDKVNIQYYQYHDTFIGTDGFNAGMKNLGEAAQADDTSANPHTYYDFGERFIAGGSNAEKVRITWTEKNLYVEADLKLQDTRTAAAYTIASDRTVLINGYEKGTLSWPSNVREQADELTAAVLGKVTTEHDGAATVEFKDENGDSWQTYAWAGATNAGNLVPGNSGMNVRVTYAATASYPALTVAFTVNYVESRKPADIELTKMEFAMDLWVDADAIKAVQDVVDIKDNNGATVSDATFAVVLSKNEFGNNIATVTVSSEGENYVANTTGSTFKIEFTQNTYNVIWVNGSEQVSVPYHLGDAVVEYTAFTKEGYTFAGWDVVIPETMPAEDVTITAKWNINQYTITFDTVGGTEIDGIKQDYATAVTKPADPTKTGYTFAGWDAEIPATMPAENMTITAQWTINQYTITFDTVGGTVIDPITQDYATAVTAPADPAKTGYTFAGWDVEIPATMPAEDMTITAKWTINQYTFTFMNGDTEVKKITQDFGTKVTAPEALEAPETDGDSNIFFGGWVIYDAENKVIDNVNNYLTMPAEDKVFVAHWVDIALPTATVTEIENDKLTFALNFLADEASEDQLTYYGDWYADYVLTINKKATFNADDTADGFLGGQYDWYSPDLVYVPVEDVTMEANESLKIMEYAAQLMNNPDLKFTYAMVYDLVKDFDCGIYFTPDYLAANQDLVVTLELRMFNPADEKESYVIGRTYEFRAPQYVAKIPGVDGAENRYFTTWADAYEAAADGDTIELLNDITLKTKLLINKDITVDGNGFKFIADKDTVWFDVETSITGNTWNDYYPWVVLQADANGCTFVDVVIDSNNCAGGVKIETNNVLFADVTILGAKADGITVAGSLNLKNYLNIETTSSMIDARSGVVNAEAGTVFGMDSWRASVKPATSDLKQVEDGKGNLFFCAYSDTTYYYNIKQALTSTKITLLKDCTANGASISGTKTIDLNGKTLTIAEGEMLKYTGALVLENEGAIVGDIGLGANKATVTVPVDMDIEDSIKNAIQDSKYDVVYLADKSTAETSVYGLGTTTSFIYNNEWENEDLVLQAGSGFRLPDSAMVKEGFLFAGWEPEMVFNDEGVHIPVESVTYTAKWDADADKDGKVDGSEEDPYWTIKIQKADGEFDTLENVLNVVPDTYPEPKKIDKKNAIFVGWDKVVDDVNRVITFNAVWNENDLNDNEIDDAVETVVIDVVTAVEGDAISTNDAIQVENSNKWVFDSSKTTALTIVATPVVVDKISKSYVASVTNNGEAVVPTYAPETFAATVTIALDAIQTVAEGEEPVYQTIQINFAVAEFIYTGNVMDYYPGMEIPSVGELYDNFVESPSAEGATEITVKYKAREAMTHTVNIDSLKLSDTLKWLLKLVNGNKETFTIDMPELWLDFDAEIKESVDLNTAVVNNLTEDSVKAVYSAYLSGGKDAAIAELKKISATVINAALYYEAHEFGYNATPNETVQEQIKITYASEAMYIEGQTEIELKDPRAASFIKGNNVTLVYRDYTDADMLSAIAATLCDENGEVIDGEIYSVELNESTYEGYGASDTAYELKLKFAGNESYKPAENTFNVTIVKAPLSIDTPNRVVTYGQANGIEPVYSLGNKYGDVNEVKDSTIRFIVGLDVADLDVDLEGNVSGLNGKIQIMLTDELQGMLDAVFGKETEGLTMTLSELKQYLELINDESLGILSNAINSILNIAEAGDMEITIGGSEPTDIGLYLHGAVTTSSNYETAFDAGYLVIVPDAKQVYLDWDYNDTNGIFTWELLQHVDFGASAYDDAAFASRNDAATEQVKSFFFGIDSNAEIFFALNPTKDMIGNGAYTQIAFIAEFGNEMYYAVPIVRAFLITPNEVKVEIIDEGVRVFDNEEQIAEVNLSYNGSNITVDKQYLTVGYTGVQANGQLYGVDDDATEIGDITSIADLTELATKFATRQAPTHAGVYVVTATYIQKDESGNVIAMGMDVQEMIIAPTTSTIEVEDEIRLKSSLEEGEVAIDSLVTVTSAVENIKPDYTTITGSVSIDGGMTLADINGTLNVDLPNWVYELGYLPENLKDGVTVTGLISAIESAAASIDSALAEVGLNAEFSNLADSLIEMLKQIPGDQKVTFEDKYVVNEIGAYIVVGIVTDSDHIPSVDTGILVIAPQVAEINFLEDTGDNNQFLRTYNGDEQTVKAEVMINGVAITEEQYKNLTIYYTGIESTIPTAENNNTPAYLPKAKAPTETGVYMVTAVYYEKDASGTIAAIGVETGVMVIQPAEAEIKVEGGVYTVTEAADMTANGQITATEGAEKTVITAGVKLDSDLIKSIAKGVLKIEDIDLMNTVAYANIDLPEWLDAVLEGAEFDGDVTVETLIKTLNDIKVAYAEAKAAARELAKEEAVKAIAGALAGIVNVDVETVIESLKIADDNIEATLDELIASLGEFDPALKVTTDDDFALNNPGIYMVIGVITDSDYMPAVASGIVIVTPNIAEITFVDANENNQWVRTYNGEAQEVAIESITIAGEPATEAAVVIYTGVESVIDTPAYLPKTQAPSETGAYIVTAFYYEEDENGIQAVGFEAGVLVIVPAEAEITVDSKISSEDVAVNDLVKTEPSENVETTAITTGVKVNAETLDKILENIKAGEMPESIDDLYTYVNTANVDLPAWLDDALEAYGFDGDVQVGTLITYIEKIEALYAEYKAKALEMTEDEAIKAVAGAMAELAEIDVAAMIEALKEVDDNIEATMAAVKTELGMYDAALVVSTDDNYVASENGLYLVIGIVTDSDYMPAVAFNYVVIAPVLAEIKIDSAIHTFDGTAKLADYVIMENGETIEIGEDDHFVLNYTGVQTDGKLYNSTEAPVYAGVYVATAAYYRNVNGNLEAVGAGAGVIVIEPAELDLDVVTTEFGYDGEDKVPVVTINGNDTYTTVITAIRMGDTVNVNVDAETVALIKSVIAALDETYDAAKELPEDVKNLIKGMAYLAGFDANDIDQLKKLVTDAANDNVQISDYIAALNKLERMLTAARDKADELVDTYGADAIAKISEVLGADAAELVTAYGDKLADYVKVYSAKAISAVSNLTAAIEAEGVTKVTINGENPSDVGEYGFVSVGYLNSDHYLAVAKDTLVIEPIEIEVTIADNSKVYGEVDPEPVSTYTYEVVNADKMVDGDELVVNLTRTAGEDVGTYDITATKAYVEDGNDGKNYIVKIVNAEEKAKFTIAEKKIFIKIAEDVAITYGDELPADIGYTVTDENGNAITVDGLTLNFIVKSGDQVITDVATANAGEYVITSTDAKANGYAITVTDGKLTINKADITVKVDNATKVYGENDPAFTATVEGMKNGETLNFTFSREQGEDVGNIYMISAEVAEDSAAVAANYNITSIEKGKLSITAKAVIVTVADVTVNVGDEIPAFTATVELIEVAVEDLQLVYTVTDTAGNVYTDLTNLAAGEYKITATVGNKNYVAEAAEAKLTVAEIAGTITKGEWWMRLDAVVYMKYYMNVSGFAEDYDFANNGGAVIWTGDANPTSSNQLMVGMENTKIKMGWDYDEQGWYFISDEIYAKNLGDVIFIRPFVEVAEGEYIYMNGATGNSPARFCYDKITSGDSTDAERNVCATLLEYGASAQKYFGYETDNLVTDIPTNDKPAWKAIDLSKYDIAFNTEYLDALNVTNHVRQIANTLEGVKSGVKKNGDAILDLVGAIRMTVPYDIDTSIIDVNNISSAKVLFWTEDDIEKIDRLTVSNASYVSNLKKASTSVELAQGDYVGRSHYILAKKLSDTIFVCAVIEMNDGTVYRSGLTALSPEAFVASVLKGESDTLRANCCKKIAVYSEMARRCFGDN